MKREEESWWHDGGGVGDVVEGLGQRWEERKEGEGRALSRVVWEFGEEMGSGGRERGQRTRSWHAEGTISPLLARSLALHTRQPIPATVALVLATLGFVVGGVGILAGWDWGRSLVAGAAVFSALLFGLMWNGKRENLDGQGAVGFLIDVALLIVTVGFQWPR